MTEQWEEIEVPRGAYVSWGTQPGQAVTGRVVDFSLNGGTDFGGAPCPQLSLELKEPTYSVSKDGQRTTFQPGDLVVLNCGLVSLKRAVRAAQPAAGDLVKIEFASTVRVPNGEVKEFSIKIARGAGQAANRASSPQPPAAGWGTQAQQAAPPF